MKRLNEIVEIPVWAITIILSVLIGLSGYVYSQGSLSYKVDTCKERIDAMEQQKANKEDVDRIYKSLERIENKIDSYIIKSK